MSGVTSVRIMAAHAPIAVCLGLSKTTAVLSIGRLGVVTGADYYLANVANSVDDYYLGRGEAPGQWIGATSAALDLPGVVDCVALQNLLDGRGGGEEDLGIMRRSGRRPGFDLTFSAPKGVSLLWAFGSPEVRDVVSSAHDRAIAGVIDHLSAEAAYVRRGKDGKDLVRAHGFIAAGFRHRTSRDGDPQLHTHVLIPNVVCGTDGRWSAPDARQLYLWQKAATAMYQSALRAELAPLGVSWSVRRNGLGELSDIPKTVLRAFSKRRVDIEAALEKTGFDSQRAAEVAALATRRHKPGHLEHSDVLRKRWATELANVTLTDETGGPRPGAISDITGALGVGQGVSVSGASASDTEREEILAVLAGERSVDLADYDLSDPTAARIAPLTLFASTFTYRDALAAVARAFDASPRQVARLTRQLLDRDDVLWMIGDGNAQPDVSGRGRERRAATVGDRRYTTVEMLRVEGRIVNSAVRRVGRSAGHVSARTIDQVLANNLHLDGEQADGVRQLLGSGNGLDLVIGQAGTGKSTMLGAARVGWESAGYQVVGTAIASRTAAELQASTGIESITMARLFIDLEGGHATLTRRHVIVVDEASLVGSRTLDRLQRQVDGARAKLVLVGDNRQLSSIDAGGALRSLSKTLAAHVVELTTNRRQSEVDQEWERQALLQLRNGDIAPSIAAYAAHDRIAIAADVVAARQQLIDRWWSVHAEATTAIMAVTRADVAALNQLARQRRRDAGELGEELRFASGKEFAVGDRILFEKNARARLARPDPGGRASTVAIRNGTFATVVAVPGDPSDSPPTREGDVPPNQGDVSQGKRDQALVVELASGQHVTLSSQYLEESTSLGYALTVFRSQGITVDHAFLFGNDTLFQEAGYTALSRGRLSNHLYAVASENPRAEIAHGDEVTWHQDALAGLVDALSRSHEQTMALESLPTRSTGARITRDGERSVSGPMGEPPQPSVEEWFQRFGRDLARNEERAHEPPTRDPGLTWSYDDDLSYGRDYDDGFGL
jgi:conjugative relaxase-like TrwC/TraI family protein